MQRHSIRSFWVAPLAYLAITGLSACGNTVEATPAGEASAAAVAPAPAPLAWEKPSRSAAEARVVQGLKVTGDHRGMPLVKSAAHFGESVPVGEYLMLATEGGVRIQPDEAAYRMGLVLYLGLYPGWGERDREGALNRFREAAGAGHPEAKGAVHYVETRG